MKKTLNQSDINTKILEAEKINKKLKAIIERQSRNNKSESKLLPKHNKQQKQSSIGLYNQDKQKDEQKIIKNINRKIQICKYQISKLGDHSIESYLAQIRSLEGQTKQIQTKSALVDKQIKNAEDQLNKNKKISSYDFEQYQHYYHKAQNLKRKLTNYQVLDILPDSRQKIKANRSRRKAFSVSKLINQNSEKEQNTIQKQKKKNIDKQALYRNLIKFYQQQESKLKQQIKNLEKQKNEQKIKKERIQVQIKQYQEKITKQKERLKL